MDTKRVLLVFAVIIPLWPQQVKIIFLLSGVLDLVVKNFQ